MPQMIAESHSKRFDDRTLALKMLDEAKHACNTVVVYLEQVRDVSMGPTSTTPPAAQQYAATAVPPMITACNEIIREYAFTRVKIQNLLKAWLKFEDRDQRIAEVRAPQAAEYQATIRNQAAQMKEQQAVIDRLKKEVEGLKRPRA